MIRKPPHKLHHAALEHDPQVRVGLDALPVQCESPSLTDGLGKGLLTGALIGGLAFVPVASKMLHFNLTWIEGALVGAGIGGGSGLLAAILWR